MDNMDVNLLWIESDISEQNKWILIRVERDRQLHESDWTELDDCPLLQDEKNKWITYRQKLRNIPQDFDTPESVLFPPIPN